MKQDLLSGEMVRLVAPNPETDAEHLARWGRDSEYLRLLDFDPARQWSIKKHKEWLEKDLVDTEKSDSFFFVEGRMRQFLRRDGQRWDLIYMGILRLEWERGLTDIF
jgi:hypothetical protein